jgi:hypothetical protein
MGFGSRTPDAASASGKYGLTPLDATGGGSAVIASSAGLFETNCPLHAALQK